MIANSVVFVPLVLLPLVQFSKPSGSHTIYANGSFSPMVLQHVVLPIILKGKVYAYRPHW